MERDELKQLVGSFRLQLGKALLRVENHRRKRQQLPPYGAGVEIYMAGKDHLPSGVRLLNLRVWSLRYGVSLEFVLEALLERYRHLRLASKRRDSIQLGLPVKVITGPTARQLVEEAVKQAFPSGENFKILQGPSVRPLQRLRYEDSPEQYSNSYGLAIAARRVVSEKTFRRNWRKSWNTTEP